ncbi:transporter substrate-binding protein [Rhizobium sp. FKL33]|uniref:transporter substrate-binding protein n=1 Tax=Rhizobium sp. FKL33 TaxID=2562307 RepID=UPI0010BFB52F|nr:transporter substrate-binding protein [Rhizobium sp. FKL33]
MVRHTVPLAILYSTSGPYAALGRDAIDGAMAAVAEINADGSRRFGFEARIGDPSGMAERYAGLADTAIRENGCRHVIGTITSWSRKEVLPVVERQRALLWYAFPYEGYEASDSVLYLGACPNQHLLPLFDHVLPIYGQRPFIVGSNYIWGWENGRIARELTQAAGGEVVAERFMPLGSEEVEHLIAEIRQKKPDFILSNLVGRSANAFIRAYADLRAADPSFAWDRRPIVACNLSESDLDGLSPAAKAGHITVGTYLANLDSEDNSRFKQKIHARHGALRRITGPFAFAYMAVSMLGQAISDAGTDDPDAIRAVVTSRRFATPVGDVAIDRRTHHAALAPIFGRSEEDGSFSILETVREPIQADPYLLTATHATMRMPLSSSGLKVVK